MTSTSKAPPKLSLPWKTIADLQPERAMSWIAKPFLAKGTIFKLSGPAKAGGKTTFVMDLLRGVFLRGTFLGEPVPADLSLAYMTEESEVTFWLALERAGLLSVDPTRFHILKYTDSPRDWETTSQKLLHDVVTLQPDILVIDTFPQFAFSGDASENDANEGLKAIAPIRRIAALDVGVILIVHDRKAGGPVGKSARGTGALDGAVDVLGQITRKTAKASTIRVLRLLSRLGEVQEEMTIDLDPDQGYTKIQAGQPQLPDSRKAILEVLRTNPEPMTVAVLVKLSGLKESTVYKAVAELAEEGLVQASGNGARGAPCKYSLLEVAPCL